MNKILLSSLATLTLSSVVYAETLTLYTDPATGQVFTTAGENRVEMGDFIDAKTVFEENQAQDSAIAKKEAKDKSVDVFSKTSKLKFSGLHYLGYRYRDNKDSDGESQFETRRNYFQVKAYLFDDPKSYMRTTLDTHQDDDGNWMVRLKYAYLYLNEVLPYTGVEFGQVHRPWIDYEEHNSFFYRSVSKVFVESKNASDLTNSADLGFNFKTKMPYYSSEVGLFNGEGYHAEEKGYSVSAEWRFTGHILGTGKTQKDKPTTTTYWDASFFGQYNIDNSKYEYTNPDGSTDGQTYQFYALHTVYNMPSFMIGGQYVISDFDFEDKTATDSWYKKNGKGFSIHAVGRFGDDKEFELFGRYDNWEGENANDNATDGKLNKFTTHNYIYGVAWQQNKNVKWLLNGITYNPEDEMNYKGDGADKGVQEFTDIMLTAEVHW